MPVKAQQNPPDTTLQRRAIIKKSKITTDKSLKIYPNPANEFVSISYNVTVLTNALRLQITDAMGKTVLEKELGKAQQIIDIREFAKGSYYCTVYNNGKALDTVKFIKK